MRISNKLYDKLKWICTIFMPALTTLWLTIASIWNIPYGEPIGATMGGVTVFIGALIGVSTMQYRKDMNDEN